VELTPEIKAEILADFKEWSGGFDPNEVEPEKIRIYARFTLDRKYDENVVRPWLLAYGFEDLQASNKD
jgi:hypothetical protein